MSDNLKAAVEADFARLAQELAEARHDIAATKAKTSELDARPLELEKWAENIAGRVAELRRQWDAFINGPECDWQETTDDR